MLSCDLFKINTIVKHGIQDRHLLAYYNFFPSLNISLYYIKVNHCDLGITEKHSILKSKFIKIKM